MQTQKITLTLTHKTADALQFIYRAYYFGLFEPIRRDEEEEYDLREALKELNEAIEATHQKEKHQ